MTEMMNDARLRELVYLAKLEREGLLRDSDAKDSPHRRLLVHLVHEGYVNDASRSHWPDYDNVFRENINMLQQRIEKEKWTNIARLVAGQDVGLQISHRGSVRRSELEQALKTGRAREEFGILLAGRYWERDLSIALLGASTAAPVSVAFLDMNGLKAINDTLGHAIGDDAIKTFLHAVSSAIEDTGEAFRVGGDEVVVILSGVNADAARDRMSALLMQLGMEKFLDGKLTLTASVGIACSTSTKITASELRQRADKAQYRAKAMSGKGAHRTSTLALEDGDVRLL